MAKGKSSSNYDAVGGIFDFIFSEADKPVDKRRPVRPTGFSAGGALTDQMFAVLEKPGVFISNNLIDEFNGALDVTIAEENFNEYGKIKVSTNNLAGYLKDPAAQVKKALVRAKAIRKASRVRMLGETMNDILTTAWAHKYGDLEAKKITLATASANEKMESYKVAKAVGESGRPTVRVTGPDLEDAQTVYEVDRTQDIMINRTVDLMGRKAFGSSWDGMSEVEKVKFANFLNKKPTKIDTQDFLDRNYGTPVALSFATVALPFDDTEKIDIKDPETYKTLENEYVTNEITALAGFAPSTPEGKKREIYEKTKGLINLRTQKQIKDLRKKLISPTLTPRERARINQAILDGETALRSVGGGIILVSAIGRWEGYINSINNVWGGVFGAQNLVPSIFNGDYFDSGKNPQGPTTESGKLGIKGLDNMKIVVAKTGNNKLINAYNQMGEALYYMTPRAIFKTFLVNGEGFARLLYRDRMSLKNLENDFGGFGALGFTAEEITKGIDERVNEDLRVYINSALSAITAGGALTPDNLEKITKLLNNSKNMRNLTHFFSFPARLNGVVSARIKKSLIGPHMKKARTNIVKFFLKNKSIAKWVAKTGGGKLLRTFIQEGGLKNLFKPIVTAIAGTLGIALTPIGGFLITIATGAALDLAMKGVSVLLQIGKIILIAIVAAVVLGLGGAKKTWKKFNQKSYSYNYVVPDTVKQCEVYDEIYAGGIKDPNNPYPNPGDPDFPPYSGDGDVYEIFAQAREYVSSNFRAVSTSLVLIDCPGHEMCDKIGWAWCYSAGSIYCRSDKLPGASPQYIYELSVHELLHQIQGWGACDTDMREWGADYLSNNGGGYTFSTTSGCKKATQVDTSSCSGSEATNAALCWDTNTSCWSSIRSQINGRFCN